MTEPIPLLRVAGSHPEVGAQIGLATADAVRRATAAPFDAELVERYRAVTVEHVPWVVEELDGAAGAAGVEPLAVFAASVEELEGAPAPTGCTDLVAAGAVTADGHLLVGHNNDLAADDEDDVVAIEWRVPGEPVVLTLGIGPWASVGWNDAGLSVTGNELTPGDERMGIPRLLQMRDVLTRRTLAEAVEAVLHPARASSY
ncbi:MAG: C45 family autoproteolytic acyltransferase/hydrolase, partial [Gaiellaceae bacterium]